MARSITFVIEGDEDTQITITEQDDGTLLFEIEVLYPSEDSDLRALYFDFDGEDEDLIGGLTITGVDVTNSDTGNNSINDLGGGTSIKGKVVNGRGNFDVGVALGTPGTGVDTIQSTSFVLESDERDLTLEDISLQDFGLRLNGSKNGGKSPGVETENTDPDAVADVIIVSVSTDAVIPVEWLLANDTDADEGDTLTVTAIDDTGLPAGWVVTPIFSEGNLVSFTVTFTVTTPGAVIAPLVLNYTLSDGTSDVMSTVTIDLAEPSTAGADSIDITAEVYDFSFIEGKDGSDRLAGSTSDDLLFAGKQDGSDTAGASNFVVGDATFGFIPVTFSTGVVFTGGDDVIIGGDDANNNFFGDARFVSFTALGGDDGEMFIGGDDTLIGGDNVSGVSDTNNLVGDAQSVQNDGVFQGGDDVLIGGDNLSASGSAVNNMVGDVSSGLGTVLTGGNDTLISGENATDNMTGDFGSGVVGQVPEIGGEDTFVFGLYNGADLIKDFRSTDNDGNALNGVGDTINLAGMGLSFATFDTGGTAGVLDAGDSFITISGGSTIIDLGLATGTSAIAGVHTVTVADVTGLMADDFDFVIVIVPDALIV